MADPLSITASIAGILSLTIEVSKIPREQISTYRGALKDTQEILNQVNGIAQVLQSLERLIVKIATIIHFQKASALITTCDDVHDHIFKLRKDLGKVVRVEGRFKESVQKCKWIFTVEERKKVLKTLREYLNTFHMSLDIEGLEMLAKSAADIKALQVEEAELIGHSQRTRQVPLLLLFSKPKEL
ncbi:hypothetical protein IFR05_001193 [Cadophora sp. M221]|nr:hypothetical protein IFR05_001193 [Cadophora sp. M221]